MGIKIAISSDSHTVDGFQVLRFGVDQARRGWLEPDDVINTLDINVLLKTISRK
jgi:DNA polymerase (family X)